MIETFFTWLWWFLNNQESIFWRMVGLVFIGTIVVQLLIGAVVLGVHAVKFYRTRIRGKC